MYVVSKQNQVSALDISVSIVYISLKVRLAVKKSR